MAATEVSQPTIETTAGVLILFARELVTGGIEGDLAERLVLMAAEHVLRNELMVRNA